MLGLFKKNGRIPEIVIPMYCCTSGATRELFWDSPLYHHLELVYAQSGNSYP